jgi:hypothetical protein
MYRCRHLQPFQRLGPSSRCYCLSGVGSRLEQVDKLLVTAILVLQQVLIFADIGVFCKPGRLL